MKNSNLTGPHLHQHPDHVNILFDPIGFNILLVCFAGISVRPGASTGKSTW